MIWLTVSQAHSGCGVRTNLKGVRLKELGSQFRGSSKYPLGMKRAPIAQGCGVDSELTNGKLCRTETWPPIFLML